jgi:hypothetical protein
MNSYRTHPERFISIFPLPYYWSGITIGEMLFLLSASITIFFEETSQYILTCLVLSILVVLQCIIIFWAHKTIRLLRDVLVEMIDLPKEQTLKWYEGQEAVIFNDKMMIFSGVVITIIAHVLNLDNFGFSFHSIYSNFIFKFDYYFAHYLMGAGLYVLIATALMVYRMSELPLDINILLSKNIRFKGIVYSKFTICATIIYLLWGIFHLSTPSSLSTFSSKLWFSSFALILLAYFIIPQYSIYRIILKTKKERLKIFSLNLQNSAEKAFRNPTKESLSYLNNLVGVVERLDEMCEWPFGSYEVLHIILIVIIPLMVLVFEVVFEIVRNAE